MKIICIGRNYVDHVKELKNDLPSEPVIFLKPDSALIQKNKPFFYPDFSNDIHHELELVIRINRLGKHIEESFAHKYFDQVAIGIDFTARDIQAECKKKGLPWEKAKAFDGSAPISKFINLDQYGKLEDLEYSLEVNGDLRQKGTTSLMIFNVYKLISHISKFMTLKIGDMIFTGTPAGVGPVKIGDQLVGRLNGEKLLDFRIK